jgi:hypothetical protein
MGALRKINTSDAERISAIRAEAEAHLPRPKLIGCRESGVHSVVRGSHSENVSAQIGSATPEPTTVPPFSGRIRNDVLRRSRVVTCAIFDDALRTVGISNADLASAWDCSEQYARERRIGERPLEFGLVVVAYHRLPALREQLRLLVEALFRTGDTK